MALTFEWDEDKAKTNFRKHKVTFEEAKSVFNDPLLLTFPDPDHSDDEERYLNIGMSLKRRVLIVVHTERYQTIRLISSRKATRSQRRAYKEGDF